ncbi:hypothetical protein ACH5RR_010157 [Cinchona calisaya]|uniref:RING-type domain-containing protein n=1 Tax=Cinchona calisaya TaxID=153742 RepID=A0ABD3AIE1_9GENT
MGFDIGCIIDIQVCPVGYFCPLCRTLVYPSEALQSQCAHLWCKQCLAHVASNSRACPYDGCLVTEADSKPLVESDRALAEKIGKVKVRCLYHKSGCTWEGPLSECGSHYYGCAFEESPVLCYQCGIKILHLQVHEHAQSCPGAYQVQQAADSYQVVPSSGLTGATWTANQNKGTSQAGAPISQSQNSQSAPAPILPGQGFNQQANPNSQTPFAVPCVAPNTDRWHQQHYQQYYQQYAGYNSYQQAYPQYYPYQQLAVLQYQQHPPQVLWQPQLQVYSQVQAQSSSQPHVQPHTQTQPHNPVQPQTSAQPQPVQSQTKTQAEFQPGPALLHSDVQPFAPQNQNQARVNPQQLLHPAMQSHAGNTSQAHSMYGLSVPQTQHYNHLQPQPQSVQPQPQSVQAIYQQPHLPMHHQQPSQVHLQTHMPTQRQSQIQPQLQIQPQPHLHPHLLPAELNQPTALSAQPESVHFSGNAILGHQSHLQPLPPQQQLTSAYPASGPLPSGQMLGQVPLEPPLMRQPPLQGPLPNQQPALFSSQGQACGLPPAQQLQFHPQTPQACLPNQQHPMIHSSQQSVPQQFVQQQLFPSSVQSQLNHQSHLVQQQSQLHPQGPPLVMQQSSNAYVQLQQNVAVTPGVQPQQPQDYVVRPSMANQGVPTQPQPVAQSSGGFVAGTQVRPDQLGPYQHCTNQNFGKTNDQLQTASDQKLLQSGMTSSSGVMLMWGDNVSGKTSTVYEAGLLSQNATEKDANAPRVDSVELKPLKSDIGMTYEQGKTRDSTEPAPPSGPPPQAQVAGYPSVSVRPQGSGLLPQSRQPLNPNEQLQSLLPRQSHEVPPGGIPVSGSMASFGRAPAAFGAPQGPPLTTLPPGSADPQVGILGRAPQHGPEGQSSQQHSVTLLEARMLPNQMQNKFDGGHTKLPGSFERGPFGLPSGVEPNAVWMNVGIGLDKSSLGSQDDRYKALPGEQLNSTKEVTWPQDQGSRPLDKAPPGSSYDARPTLDSAGGSGIVRRDLTNLVPRNPGKDYRGKEVASFGEGSRHSPPLNPRGNPFHENRFLRLPGNPQRGEHDDGLEGLKFGELRGPGPHDQLRRADLFGQDVPPGHFRRGELLGSGNSLSHYVAFPAGHAQSGEPSAPANHPHKLNHGETFAGNKPGLRQVGEPAFRGSSSLQGDMSNFGNPRKKKHASRGWCRICKVDCETVEGLDMHSQTREHQHMSMDMVVNIKQQNKKKSKASNDRAGHEGATKKRNTGPEGHGKKPYDQTPIVGA